MVLIFLIIAYGISRQDYDNYYGSPHYRAMIQGQIDFLTQELQREVLNEENKKQLEQSIADLKYELEVGYQKAREVTWAREKAELEEKLANNTIDARTRKHLEMKLKMLEAKLEYGEHTVEVNKLELEGRLLSLKSSLKTTQDPQEKIRIEMAIIETQLNLEKSQFEYNENAFSLLIIFLINTSSFFLPLIIVLVASEAISGEFSLGTIKLLLIKPFSRAKLYISKYIALLIYGVSLFIFMSMAGYVIGGFFVGFGGASLTRIVGQVNLGKEFGYLTDYSSAYLVTNFQYLLMMLGLFVFVVAITVAFSMLVSVFTKSATISIVATMGLIIFGSILSSLLNQNYLVKYLPMPHFEVIRHLEGSFWLPDVTLNFSAAIMCFYSLIFLAMGILSFRKKDIL